MNRYKTVLNHIRKNKLNIKDEVVSLNKSLNRVSSYNVFSKSVYPSENNTAFDGFSINSKETKKLNKKKVQKFKIIKTLAAGDNPKIKKIPKFSAIEVMTGAIIRKPFDTVIPIEDIKYFPNKSNAKYILINKKVKKSDFIRPKGSDYKKGDKIIKKGELINPSHILALKTLGIDKLSVKKKINVVFYPTGNELSDKKKIPSWKIKNSNTAYLKSLIKNLPVNLTVKKIIKDNEIKSFTNQIKKKLKSNADIIITSGAVSAGKFDFIPSLIKKLKLKSMIKGAKIRPGKPIMFAKFRNNKCFFGLPGNPISTVACFRFFVFPLLYVSLSLNGEKPITAKIKNNFSKKKNFTRFIKGKLTFSKYGIAEFKVLKGQESYKINPFTKSNAWGVLKDGITNFKKGDFIDCYSSSGINEFLMQ